MKSLRFLDRRAGYSLASLGLLLGIVAPAAVPAFASASGAITARSITMSSSAVDATGVTYDLKFTGATDIATGGGVIVNFCSESPLLVDTCTGPSGMDTSGVGVGTVKYAGSAAAGNGSVASLTGDTAIKWTAGDDYTHATTIEIPLTGIVNPSAPAGTFYARVTTYTSAAHLTTGDETDPGTYDDEGAVALSTADTVGVTAYVLESMTFCVAHTALDPNCGGTLDSPSMTLGQTTGSVTALEAGSLSTGQDYAQLSTNAVSGAVVNLHSNTTACGGLVRNYGSANCDIVAQAVPTSTTIAAGTAAFGLTVGSAVSATGATNPTGTLAPTNGYDATHYFIDYDAGDTTGVTSTYGSALFNSAGAPVSNKNIPFTFAASISNSTPAGIYGATLGLTATGTF